MAARVTASSSPSPLIQRMTGRELFEKNRPGHLAAARASSSTTIVARVFLTFALSTRRILKCLNKLKTMAFLW